MRRILVCAALLGCGDNKGGGVVPDGGHHDGSIPITDGGSHRDGGGSTIDGGGVTCIPGLTSLALSPAHQDVSLDGTTASNITYTAMSGSTTIASSKLAWSVARTDDTDPGAIANGVFTPNPGAGGTVTVTATDGCVSAT